MERCKDCGIGLYWQDYGNGGRIQEEIESKRMHNRERCLTRQLSLLKSENEMLTASISTPEVYAGAISKAIEIENEKLVDAVIQRDKEMTRLLMIIDRLPKTADGVPVIPGEDTVYAKSCCRPHDVKKYTAGRDKCWNSNYTGWMPISRCYSTEEEAKEATVI